MELLNVCLAADLFIQDQEDLYGEGTQSHSNLVCVGNELRHAIAKAHDFRDDAPENEREDEEYEIDNNILQREIRILKAIEDHLERLCDNPPLINPDESNGLRQDEEDRNELRNLVFNCIQRRK